MCGKFTQMLAWAELVELADLQSTNNAGGDDTITPMRLATVITLGHDGKRKALRMRWGLIPPGVRDPATAKPHIHARAESIDIKPTFRDAFQKRRGLVVVSTFNEGREITPTKTEQHILTPKDGRPVAIAVIWERWSERQGSSLLTFAMVTVPPNELIGTITNRMPAVIDGPDWPKWLGEEPASIAEIKAMLRPSQRDLDMRAAATPPRKRTSGQQELF